LDTYEIGITARMVEVAEFAKSLAQRLSQATPTCAIETDTEMYTRVRFGGLIKRPATRTVVRSTGWLITSQLLGQANEPGRKVKEYRDYFLMTNGTLTMRNKKIEIVNGVESISHGALAPATEQNIMDFDYQPEQRLDFDDPWSSVRMVRGKRVHDQFGGGFVGHLRRLEAKPRQH
jgi:hypothetical protein